MAQYNEVYGDLIELAKEGKFDVIAHGCNCLNTQGAGIAVRMAETFGTDRFEKEHPRYFNDINKLGTIDYEKLGLRKWDDQYERYNEEQDEEGVYKTTLIVVNAYTQQHWGRLTLDYEALRLTLRKMNKQFAGQHIGLPQIGCGLAGGKWEIVKNMIDQEMRDVQVTVVIYNNSNL